MADPDWAVITQVLYRKSPELPDTDIGQDHPFVTETELDVDGAANTVGILVDWGLVTEEEISRKGGEYNPDSGKITGEEVTAGYKLTTEGFDVAHERELSERSSRINRSLAVFTLVLVLISGVDVLPLGWKVRSGAIALLLVAVLVQALRADIFG